MMLASAETWGVNVANSVYPTNWAVEILEKRRGGDALVGRLGTAKGIGDEDICVVSGALLLAP